MMELEENQLKIYFPKKIKLEILFKIIIGFFCKFSVHSFEFYLRMLLNNLFEYS